MVPHSEGSALSLFGRALSPWREESLKSMGQAHLESLTHILDVLLGPKQPECFPGSHRYLPWASPPKGRLRSWYTARRPEGDQGIAVWGCGQSSDTQWSVRVCMYMRGSFTEWNQERERKRTDGAALLPSPHLRVEFPELKNSKFPSGLPGP